MAFVLTIYVIYTITMHRFNLLLFDDMSIGLHVYVSLVIDVTSFRSLLVWTVNISCNLLTCVQVTPLKEVMSLVFGFFLT